MARMKAALPAAVALFCGFAVFVRLLVKDCVAGFSMIYYATPPIVLALLAAGCATIWAKRRQWRHASVSIVATFLFAIWWVSASYVRNDAPPPGPGLRVLFWNAARGAAGWPAVADQVRAWDADIVCMVEAGSDAAFWHSAFPDRETRTLGGGLVAIVKGRIHEASVVALAGRSRAAVLRLDALAVVLVDIDGAVYRHRGEAFGRLRTLLKPLQTGPLLVMGDFNTPRDSLFFESWRKDSLHAFEAAGSGFDATWPVPLPVLAIDHVWCGGGLRPLRCELLSSSSSDHRAVAVEIAR